MPDKPHPWSRPRSGAPQAAGPAEPLVRPPDTEEETKTRDSIDSPWQVIIHNDPVNLMTYVVVVIRKVFGYPEEKARRMMLEVHEQGKSIVWTGNRERAELYVQQLQQHQLLASMSRID